MDGGIQGTPLNHRGRCLVWKPCSLRCLGRRGAALVDVLEQAASLLLAEDLNRQQICKDEREG